MEQPIRILQRPSNVSVEKPEEKAANTVQPKTREQREADYAAARLRILGSEKPENDKPEQNTATTNVKLSSSPTTTKQLINADDLIDDNEADAQDASAEKPTDSSKVTPAAPAVLEKPNVAKKKQQMPPSLMSIETRPCLDALSGFKTLGKPLLSSLANVSLYNIQPQQAMPRNGKNGNGRSSNVCQKPLQNQALHQNNALCHSRYSDSSLFSHYSQPIPTGQSMQPPQNMPFQQQQMPLLMQNWDNSQYPPLFNQNSIGGKQMVMSNNVPGGLPSQMRPVPTGPMGMPNSGNEAAMLAAVLAAASVSNPNAGAPGSCNMMTPVDGLMCVDASVNMNAFNMGNTNNNNICSGVGKDQAAQWHANNSVNGMRLVSSQPSFQQLRQSQTQPSHQPNRRNLQKVAANMQVTSGYDGLNNSVMGGWHGYA